MTVSPYSLAGWHTQASVNREGLRLSPTRYNGFRVLGYLPVGGILMGLMDIVCTKDEKLATRVYGIARGILEILGLGILFLILDLAVSAHRHFSATTPNAKKA
jgi:sulfite exporter TauE/SafE